jgi:hypothetical protein
MRWWESLRPAQESRPAGRAGRKAVGHSRAASGEVGWLRSSTVRLVATPTPEAVAAVLNCSSEASTFAIFAATSRGAGSCGRRVCNGLTRQHWKAIVNLDGLVTCAVRSWESVRPPEQEAPRGACGQEPGVGQGNMRTGWLRNRRRGWTGKTGRGWVAGWAGSKGDRSMHRCGRRNRWSHSLPLRHAIKSS